LSQLESELKDRISTIILCAGEGKRLKAITKDIPKPLISIRPLGNISLIQYTIDILLTLGIERIAIVKGHLGNKLDEHLNSVKKLKSLIANKIFLINSGNQYKLGPLHSFLSVMNDQQFFKENYIYPVIPGDTIFDYHLLYNIFMFIIENFNIIQKFPVIFYRKIESRILREKHKDLLKKHSKKISIADIKTTSSFESITQIKQIDLVSLPDSGLIYQLIPIFVFNYNFFYEIKEIEYLSSIETIKDILNKLIANGKEFIALNIENKGDFYDIDYKLDLLGLEDFLRKRDNSKSSET